MLRLRSRVRELSAAAVDSLSPWKQSDFSRLAASHRQSAITWRSPVCGHRYASGSQNEVTQEYKPIKKLLVANRGTV